MSSIVQLGDPILRQQAKPLSKTEIKSQFIQDLIHSMKHAMRNVPGVGLAAPQVGVSVQLAVIEDNEMRMTGLTSLIRREREREPIQFHVIINPTLKIINPSPNLFFESCLSVNGVSRITPRAKAVRVNFLDEQGNPQQINAHGWYARILQHEIDHLHGRLFIDFADERTEIVNNEKNKTKWLNANSQQIQAFYNKKIS